MAINVKIIHPLTGKTVYRKKERKTEKQFKDEKYFFNN